MRFTPGQAGRWQPASTEPQAGGPPVSPVAPIADPPVTNSVMPLADSSPPAAGGRPARRWASWTIVLLGALIGLRLLALPHQPALAPASRPWTAQVASLTYVGGDPATLEVKLTLNNGSAEAVRRVQATLLLPQPLKQNLVRTTFWDPLLEGGELDYWAPQTGHAVTFGLKLKGVDRDQALTLLEQVVLRMNWSPADLDPQGTRLEQNLRFADLWPVR